MSSTHLSKIRYSVRRRLVAILLVPMGIMLSSCDYFSLLEQKVQAQEKKIAELTDLVYSQQALLMQLSRSDKKFAKKLANAQLAAGPPPDPLKIPEISKKNLFIMKMHLNEYFITNNQYPETINGFKSFIMEKLGKIPMEGRSDSNVVHLKKNYQGGWVFNPDSGELVINSYKP